MEEATTSAARCFSSVRQFSKGRTSLLRFIKVAALHLRSHKKTTEANEGREENKTLRSYVSSPPLKCHFRIMRSFWQTKKYSLIFLVLFFCLPALCCCCCYRFLHHNEPAIVGSLHANIPVNSITPRVRTAKKRKRDTWVEMLSGATRRHHSLPCWLRRQQLHSTFSLFSHLKYQSIKKSRIGHPCDTPHAIQLPPNRQ